MLNPLSPPLKTGTTADIRGNQLLIKLEQRLAIHQNVPTTGFRFQLIDLVNQRQVVSLKRPFGVKVSLDQCFPDKNLAGDHGINSAVIDLATTDHNQPIQSDLFISHHLGPLFLPVRFKIITLHQVTGQRLNPLRLDLGVGAGKQSGGLHQLSGHHPLGLALV